MKPGQKKNKVFFLDKNKLIVINKKNRKVCKTLVNLVGTKIPKFKCHKDNGQYRQLSNFI